MVVCIVVVVRCVGCGWWWWWGGEVHHRHGCTDVHRCGEDADLFEQAIVETLDANAGASEANGAVFGGGGGIKGTRVHLECDLGVRRDPDQLVELGQDRAQRIGRQKRRCATADVAATGDRTGQQCGRFSHGEGGRDSRSIYLGGLVTPTTHTSNTTAIV